MAEPETRTPTLAERMKAELTADCVLTNLGFWYKLISESGAGVAVLRDPDGRKALLNDLADAKHLLSGFILGKPQS